MKWFGRGLLFGGGFMLALLCRSPETLREISDRFGGWADFLDAEEDKAYERQGKILARHLKGRAGGS